MRTRIFFDPCMGMFKNNQMVRKELVPLLVEYNKKKIRGTKKYTIIFTRKIN